MIFQTDFQVNFPLIEDESCYHQIRYVISTFAHELSVKPLQTDLPSVTGWQLKSPLKFPLQQQPETCLSLPGTHGHTPVSSPTLACQSQGYLKTLKTSVEVLFDLMTQWEIAGWASAGSLTEHWLEHRQLSDRHWWVPDHACLWPLLKNQLGSRRISIILLWAERLAGTAAPQFSCWAIILFPLLAFPVTWPQTNFTPEKEPNHILKVTQELIILFMWKKKKCYQHSVRLPLVLFKGYSSKVFFVNT